MEKVLQLNHLIKTLNSIRKNKKVIFTNGCFDILHVGHVRYLREAKSLGDILVVGVNGDSSVKRLNKGADRPVQNQNDRAEILSNLASVDFVTIFSEDTPAELIETIRPDVLVKGGDWSEDKIVGGNFVKSYGGVVKALPFVKGKSTTEILQKVRR